MTRKKKKKEDEDNDDEVFTLATLFFAPEASDVDGAMGDAMSDSGTGGMPLGVAKVESPPPPRPRGTDDGVRKLASGDMPRVRRKRASAVAGAA